MGQASIVSQVHPPFPHSLSRPSPSLHTMSHVPCSATVDFALHRFGWGQLSELPAGLPHPVSTFRHGLPSHYDEQEQMWSLPSREDRL